MMHSSRVSPLSTTVAVAIAGAATAAAFTAFAPARAGAALDVAASLITCATSAACVIGSNTNTGPGVRGNSAHTDGVVGNSAKGGYGVRGFVNGSGLGGVIGVAVLNPGVTGQSQQGAGLSGVSLTGVGARGTTGSGVGVLGQSNSFIGVEGTSVVAQGVYGTSVQYTGVQGYSAAGWGTNGISGTGLGVYGFSLSHIGVLAAASSGVGLSAVSNSGNGGDIRGTYIGAVMRAPGSGFPIVATDQNGNDLFWVNGAGDVFYRGSLNHFARVNGGYASKGFGSVSTAPTVEDTGTAQLVNGQATIRLDSAFAQSIDTSNAYRVFLTPGGDTRGLYVAAKSPAGFVVRESQGGRTTTSFDYRIVATSLGHVNEHMAIVSSAESAARVPQSKPLPEEAAPRIPPGSAIPK